MIESKQPRTPGLAVDVVAGRQFLHGTINCNGLRMLDILNEAESDFLVVDHQTDSPDPGGAPTCVGGIVPKSSIDCLLLQEEGHESPMRRQHARVAKKPHTVVVTLCDHILFGTLMATGTLSPVAILGPSGSMFFPLTETTLKHVDSSRPPTKAPVAFINKNRVVSFQVTIAR